MMAAQRKVRFGLILGLLEKKMLARLAIEEGGLSQSALIRRLIRQAAAEKGITSFAGDDERQSHNQGRIGDFV
jgi:hypothetical protein